MSPKVVDKLVKRREIALACKDLAHQGIKNITVAEAAKTAGIGKGTVYEYFENKDDIIFEIINIHIEEYHEKFLVSIQGITATREKVFEFFKFVTDDSKENIEHLNGYKDYLSVVLSDENEAMFEFNTSCNDFFKNQMTIIIDEGIKNKELNENAYNFIDGLMYFEKGLALMKMTQKDFDAKEACELFVNSLFDLIEKK